jgi:sensor histidine kinase YesM
VEYDIQATGFRLPQLSVQPLVENAVKHGVGMENTKRRLREMCGGEVVIESVVNEGTTARMILPKSSQTPESA